MRSCTVLTRLLSVSALAAFSGTLAAQQNYPNKPIRWITPYHQEEAPRHCPVWSATS